MRRWLKKHHFNRRSDGVWWRVKDNMLLIPNKADNAVVVCFTSRDTAFLLSGPTPWEATQDFLKKHRSSQKFSSRVIPSMRMPYLEYSTIQTQLRAVANERDERTTTPRQGFHDSRVHKYFRVLDELIRRSRSVLGNLPSEFHCEEEVVEEVFALLTEKGLLVKRDAPPGTFWGSSKLQLGALWFPTRQLMSLN
jgi:hypothetical protein